MLELLTLSTAYLTGPESQYYAGSIPALGQQRAGYLFRTGNA